MTEPKIEDYLINYDHLPDDEWLKEMEKRLDQWERDFRRWLHRNDKSDNG